MTKSVTSRTSVCGVVSCSRVGTSGLIFRGDGAGACTGDSSGGSSQTTAPPWTGLPIMKFFGSLGVAGRAAGAVEGRASSFATVEPTFTYGPLRGLAAAAAAFAAAASRCSRRFACISLRRRLLSRVWSRGWTPRRACSSRIPCVGYSRSAIVEGGPCTRRTIVTGVV